MKMKKALVTMLVLSVFAGVVGVTGFTVYAADTWDATIDTSWYNTSTTQFDISTAEQFAGLAAIVNGTASGISADTFGGKTVTLTNDLDLNSVNWTPIGNSNASGATKHFMGIFNGNNKVISNLSVTGAYNSTANRFFGLFGIIGTTGSVSNVGISNVNIVTTGTGSNTVQAGSLTAWNYGAIAGCYAKNVSIRDTTKIGNVGGLVGYSWGTTGSIQNCYIINITTTLTTGANFGGFVGLSAGTVSGCYMGGTYSTNLSNGTGGSSVGKFIAYGRNTGSMTNCYYEGTGTSVNGTGGTGVATGITATALKGYAYYLGSAFKIDASGTANDEYPLLTWQVGEQYYGLHTEYNKNNGTVVISADNMKTYTGVGDVYYVKAGTTVTTSFTPTTYCGFKEAISVPALSNINNFTMPAANVDITVVFDEKIKISAEAGGITTITWEEAGTQQLIVAKYTGVELTKLWMSSITVTAGEVTNLNNLVSGIDDLSGAKVFVWNSLNGMMPLRPSYTIIP